MGQKSELSKKNNIIFASVALIMVIILGVIFIPQFLSDDDPIIEYTDIRVEVAYTMINQTDTFPNLLILDVRSQGEYDSGHLNNSVLIPVDELENRLDEIAEYNSTEIIVYCASGGRSVTASNILVSNEFSLVYNMMGGITAWIGEGYPTVV